MTLFHIYVDGSVTEDITTIGLGWAIASHDLEKPEVFSARLKPFETPHLRSTDVSNRQQRQRWAMRSEFLAGAAALNFLPSGSSVLLHTDHRQLARAISEPDAWQSGIHNSYLERKKLRHTFWILKNALARHDLVQDVWEDDKSQDPIIRQNMRMAHNAAVRASGSGNIKADLSVGSNRSELETAPPIQWPPMIG